MNQGFLGFSKRYWHIFFLVFAYLFLLVLERNEFQKTEAEIRSTLKKIRQVEEVILPLELEDRFLNRLERVETLAKDKLKMTDTDKKRMQVIGE